MHIKVERERESEREREKETGSNSRCAYCAFERSVICLYLENRCVKVCNYMYMYVCLCSQSLQICFVLIIGAVYWILDHSTGTSQDMSTIP